MNKKMITNERGFTLVEMVVVIAILSLVIVMLTSLLIVPSKIASAIKFEGNGRNTSSLINSHISQSIRKNGTSNAVSLVDEQGFKNVLKITCADKTTGESLYYFFKDEMLYFQVGSKFEPNNLEDSMIIGEQVKKISFTLARNNKELRISIDAYQDIKDSSNLENNKTIIALKTN